MSWSMVAVGKAGRPEFRNAILNKVQEYEGAMPADDTAIPSLPLLTFHLAESAARQIIEHADPQLNVVLQASGVPTRNNSFTVTLTVTVYS